MHRKIFLGGVEHTADFGLLENARVTIKSGVVTVSADLTGRTAGAEFEGLFHGKQSIEVLTGPMKEGPEGRPTPDYDIGPLVMAPGEELAIAKAKKKEEIKKAWEHEIAAVGMPIPGENFSVNFDVADALIWENGLTMTTEDTVMVRGIDNVMRPMTRAKALTISGLQKQHYAAMIKKKWTLQSQIDSAATIEAVEAVKWN